MSKWYELAKTGTFKDRFGKVYTVTKEILQSVADQYAPTVFRAPITVGHPENNRAPSWGFVDAVKVAGDKLLFKPGGLVAEFAQAVNKGLYTNVSAGFSLPGWSLSHVAFLGGVAPAIKGLEQITNVEFASSESVASIDVSESTEPWVGKVEFSDGYDNWVERQLRIVARVLKRLREQKIESDGLEKANGLLSEWEVDDLGSEPPRESAAVTEFSTEGSQSVDLEKRIAELERQAAEFASRVTTLEAENVALKNENVLLKSNEQTREHAEFCDSLILQGRLPADQKDKVVRFMSALSTENKVEFSEGVQTSSLDAYKEQLKSAPVMVEFSEIATFGRMGTARDEGADKYAKLGREIAETVNPGV